MRLIGLTGAAGSGKSTAAAVLTARCGYASIPLADPMKQALMLWFGWSEDRVNGPSYMRNEPDVVWDGLTARRALQALGTEFGRAMHPDVWVRLALRTAAYCAADVVIPDVRFDNEALAIRAAGGKIVRITRPGVGLTGAAGAHASEAGIADALVDLELPNAGALWLLEARAAKLPEVLFGGAEWPS